MDFQPFEQKSDRSEYRRNLPHWRQPGCTYFVTFRLADSLPQSKLAEWHQERAQWLRRHGLDSPDAVENLPIEDQRDFHRHFTRRLHEFLDAGLGSCILRNPSDSKIVADALLFFDGTRCATGDFVVMPNHVHILVTPFAPWEPRDLLHSWKRHTAREINKRHGIQGTLWMDESFDHAVRSGDQLNYFRKYIRENPIKAKLKSGEYHLGCGTDVQT